MTGVEEHDLNFPREPQPESTLKRWMNQIMEARRHPNGYNEPDYERVLREREGQVEVRIEGGYHERGSGHGEKNSWKDWILTICAPLIVAGVGGVLWEVIELNKSQSAQQAQWAEWAKGMERRVDRIEQKVFP